MDCSRRSGAARRAQAARADARAVQRLLRGFKELEQHRGCCSSRLGAALSSVLREPVPIAPQPSPQLNPNAEVFVPTGLHGVDPSVEGRLTRIEQSINLLLGDHGHWLPPVASLAPSASVDVVMESISSETDAVAPSQPSDVVSDRRLLGKAPPPSVVNMSSASASSAALDMPVRSVTSVAQSPAAVAASVTTAVGEAPSVSCAAMDWVPKVGDYVRIAKPDSPYDDRIAEIVAESTKITDDVRYFDVKFIGMDKIRAYSLQMLRFVSRSLDSG